MLIFYRHLVRVECGLFRSRWQKMSTSGRLYLRTPLIIVEGKLIDRVCVTVKLPLNLLEHSTQIIFIFEPSFTSINQSSKFQDPGSLQYTDMNLILKNNIDNSDRLHHFKNLFQSSAGPPPRIPLTTTQLYNYINAHFRRSCPAHRLGVLPRRYDEPSTP